MADDSPAFDDKKWLNLASGAYTASTTYFDAGPRREIEADIRQFQGVHPAGSKYHSDTYRTRSKFFRPKTRGMVRKNEAIASAAFFANTDVVEVTAEDEGDKIQVAAAKLGKGLLQYRLKKTIPWFLILMGAYQDAMTQGVVISYQSWDWNEKKGIDTPKIELRPVENIRIDPGSDWADPINSSPYVIDLVPMYVKDVRAQMEVKGDDPEPKWIKCEDAVIKTATRAYSDSTSLQRVQGRADPRSTAVIDDFDQVFVHRNIVEVDGEDWIFYTLGVTHLLSKPVKLASVYRHGVRPYTMGFTVVETHKIYPGGPVRLTGQTQREINENANQRIDNVSFAMNKRYFAKRGAQVDLRSLTRNVVSSVTLMNDPEKDVKVLETQDVTSSAYQEQDRLNLDFDDIAGSFSGSTIQSNRKMNETVGGLELLSEDSNLVSSYQLRTFVETWVEPVLQQVLLLEQYFETDPAVLALVAAESKALAESGIDTISEKVLLQKLTVNCHVGIGATTPRSQLSSFVYALQQVKAALEENILQQYGLKPQEVINEVFGKLGYKTADRFFDFDSENPEVAALKQQIAELTKQVEQKEHPELTQAKIKLTLAQADAAAAGVKETDAKKVLTGVEATYAAMQSARMIALMPAVAPIADKVMQAAGYQNPNPAGIDPNFPAPMTPQPDPEVAAQAAGGMGPQNTSPMFPPKSSSGLKGIETLGGQEDMGQAPEQIQAAQDMEFAHSERTKAADHARGLEKSGHEAMVKAAIAAVLKAQEKDAEDGKVDLIGTKLEEKIVELADKFDVKLSELKKALSKSNGE